MKEYVVRLTDEKRKCCDSMIGQLAGSSQKAHRRLSALGAEVVARSAETNPRQLGVEWQMEVADVRRKLKSGLPENHCLTDH